jgi:hypothetical protein
LGYTSSLVKAGRYSEAEAWQIVHDANVGLQPPAFREIAIPDPLPGFQANRKGAGP